MAGTRSELHDIFKRTGVDTEGWMPAEDLGGRSQAQERLDQQRWLSRRLAIQQSRGMKIGRTRGAVAPSIV